MSSTIRKYYQIRCLTENANVFTWSLEEPTQCPNNASHVIGSIKLIDENESPSSLVQVVVDKSGNGNYTSVAQAFADGNSNVFVKNGTYVETSDITIPDRGKLIGETTGAVILYLAAGASVRVDGSNGVKETTGTITVTNGSAVVTGSGTTFTNLSPGNFLLIGNNFFQIQTITNDTSLTLLNTYLGASRTNETYLAQNMHTGIAIENLVITGSSNVGLFCRAMRFCHIHDVALSKNATNLYVSDSGDCSLGMFSSMNSTVGYGVHVDNCIDFLFDYCNVFNNFGHGIEVSNGSNNISFDACSSSCNGGTGYHVDSQANHLSITDGNCKQNASHGIHLTSAASHVIVNSCSITKNNVGVLMEGDGNTVSSSNICENAVGVQCTGVGLGSVKGCIFFQNTGNAIDVTGDNSVFEGNRVKNNLGKGIYVTGNDNIISSNRITANTGNGLEISGSSTNTIATCNNCAGNSGTDFIDNGTGTTSANNVVS